MPVRVGVLSVAHMHAWGYGHGLLVHPDAELVGVYDEEDARVDAYVREFGSKKYADPDDLIADSDALIICSENKAHAAWISRVAKFDKPILCEKPLCTTREEAQQIASSGAKLMTAFPCRYSPAFKRLKERVEGNELGEIQAICATNRGKSPGGWFVDLEKSGGGAMIDHVVHVTDLLRLLLRQEVVRVNAQIGNNMYGQEWDDTAMLTLEFESGIFATLDSSWSRHKSYKTWGDVTMNVVGDQGVVEVDLFSQAVDVWRTNGNTHTVAGFGSDLDSQLVNDFLSWVQQGGAPPISGFDGLQASRVAIAGYESARTGQTITL